MFNSKNRRLSFREAGIPKQIRRRIILLVACFFGFVTLLFFFINREGTARTAELSAPTLPEVVFSGAGEDFTPVHGYLAPMDGCYMRDSVVPLGKDRKLPVRIDTNGAGINAVSYEITSPDTSHKISEEKVKDYKASKDGSTITLEPELTNLVEKGQEYIFTLKLDSGGEEIYYYTRIAMSAYPHVKGCIKFAKKFSAMALSDDDTGVSTYIEPSAAETDENNLSSVTLHSSLNQIGWRSFSGKRVADPQIDVVDIGADYCSVSLTYQMKDKEKVPNYYNVVEYLKLRKGIQRYYMLDYNRSMEKIITGDNIPRDKNRIGLGIRDTSMDYISTVTGTMVAFEQAGDLFLYDHNTMRITRVFSFRGSNFDPKSEDSFLDSRRNYSEHGIKLLQIGENGSLDYCVYGYMNCGPHEGLSGINLYHYDAGNNINRERAFIVSSKSYQVLNASFADLIYESSGENFYIMLDGTLERVNLATLKTRELNTGLKSQQFAASTDGRYITWIDDGEASPKLHVMDLENEKSFTIKPDKDGELLKPLAYLEDDLIYGIVKEKDITKGLAGSALYPMYKIVIKDSTSKDGPIQKEYKKKKVYVTDVTYNSYSVTLTRVKKSGDGFTPAGEDVIRDSAGEQNRDVEISRETVSGTGTETFISMTSLSGEDEAAPLTSTDSKLVLALKSRAIRVTPSEGGENYYVYVGSSVVYASTDPAKAIKRADKASGIVVDNEANYIWKRSRPAEFASVEEYEPNITDNIPKDTKAMDLTGLSLDQVLYFIAIGLPVYADVGDELLPITAYSPENITLSHPDGTQEVIPLEEAAARFDAQGNIYLVFMPEEE